VKPLEPRIVKGTFVDPYTLHQLASSGDMMQFQRSLIEERQSVFVR
jgi:hypothetical protein